MHRNDNDPRFVSVWDAINETPQQAEEFAMRARLMRAIASLIQNANWTQSEAAAHCRVSQPRINDLLRGRISRFPLDALVNIAAALHQRVHVHLVPFDRATQGFITACPPK
jgi:predicted XRE-type DNA-binding protein